MEGRVEYFECVCTMKDHILRFTLQAHDNNDYVELYTSTFLNPHHGFWDRLWIAIEYLFWRRCKKEDGVLDCTLLKVEDVDRLIDMLNNYKRLSAERHRK